MDCLICGHDTQIFVDEKSQITFFYCSICQCIFKSPEHFKAIDEQKKQYDLHVNDPEDRGYQAYFQRFLDFVLPMAGMPKTALDFGCGESTLLADMLRQNGMASEHYDPIYHPQNLNHGKKYDLIVSTEVFEHLHDPKSVFVQLLEMLEPDGTMALQTLFHPNDIEAFKTWYYHLDPTHVVFFTSKTFKVLANMFGGTFIADNGKNIVVVRKF